MTRRLGTLLAAIVLGSGAFEPAPRLGWAFGTEISKALEGAKYVYIASERKDGSFGKPAEIWFMLHEGAVLVASPTTTWRVKRLGYGRAKARVSVGTREGPSFMAKGAIVKDKAMYEKLYRALAEKYPEGWTRFEERFRAGLADGSRVLLKYQPLD